MESEPVWEPKQVRKAVLKETLQHPVTLFCAGSSIISSLYLALISGSKLGLLFALSSMGIAIGSWIFNYFFRLDHFIKLYYEKWKKEVEEVRRKRQEGLRQDLVKLNHTEGITAYDDLVYAYERYTSFLIESKSSGLTSLQRVRMEGIAGETFDLGMKVITKLVSLVKITSTIDVARFQKEINELSNQILTVESDQASAQREKRLENLQKRRTAIQTRIDSYNHALLEIEALLTQAEECENSIENSILQMPVFSDKIDDKQLQKALSSMETTVDAARRVSEKLQRLDLNEESGYMPDDDIYLKTRR